MPFMMAPPPVTAPGYPRSGSDGPGPRVRPAPAPVRDRSPQNDDKNGATIDIAVASRLRVKKTCHGFDLVGWIKRRKSLANGVVVTITLVPITPFIDHEKNLINARR